MDKKIYGIPIKNILAVILIAGFIVVGVLVIWISTFNLPTIDSFEERRIAQSTKIYDRTGEVVLFDVHGDINRTVVPLEDISPYLQKATIAIEDDNFYNHKGVEPTAILRAVFKNLRDGNLLGGQGGSTITQQVIKNALLTNDKKVSRKIKEWVLAPRLESRMSKDEILGIYLNEIPYGGTIYGAQEASQRFFSKDAKDLTLAEAAYLAALPQAPTYFSPYGNNREDLEDRKKLVLKQMLNNDFITEEEFNTANEETVVFEKQSVFGIKAPHFVMYIREQLEQEYGKEVVEQGGLKVITTLDWDLQEKAEEIAKKHAFENEADFDAENTSLIAVEAKTGQILTMVGSRDYFDEDIDGNFNIATAERQPGSSFKPLVYAEAFNKGFRPETVVFDVKTEFSTTCAFGGDCYQPNNYDNKFRGPMSLREALAQSMNIPAVKVFYLAGLKDSLDLAKRMGITTLTDIKQYGLTLVLGGGEVRPLDMAAAYAVFANNGIQNNVTGIIKVEDKNGQVLQEYEQKENRVMPEQTALLISDVLTDRYARVPLFGIGSLLEFPGHDVAAKTGTTNNYRDAWTVGYNSEVAVAAWAGNNDNRSMVHKTSSLIVSPMWAEFMWEVVGKYPGKSFQPPAPIAPNTKPIIAGYWKGEVTEEVGEGDDKKVVVTGTKGVHTILHTVNINDPLGPAPSNPGRDPQYSMWEKGVQAWLGTQNIDTSVPKESVLKINSIQDGGTYLKDKELVISVSFAGTISESSVKINGEDFGALDPIGKSILLIPEDVPSIKDKNEVTVTLKDQLGNSYSTSMKFNVK